MPRLDGAAASRLGITPPLPSNLSLVLLLFCSLYLTNAFSWVFLVLFFHHYHHAVAFARFLPLACRSPLPSDPQYPSSSSQTPFAFRWLRRCFGSPAALPHLSLKHPICGWMGGPNTESLPRGSHRQELAAGVLGAAGLGAVGAAPLPGRALRTGEGPARGLLASH